MSGDPSAQRPTIYEHILARVSSSDAPLGLAERLPDEPETDDSRVRFAPGAWAGIHRRHFELESEESLPDRLYDLTVRHFNGGGTRTYDALCETLCFDDALEAIPVVLDRLSDADPLLPAVEALALRMATRSRRREPVKYGIALMSLLPGCPRRDVLLTLARHDEFTGECADAVLASDPDAERTLFAMAQAVEWWGRIETVDRLRGTDDPEICNWLLRHGFRNKVMYEYSTYVAATTGGLAAALADEEIDDELLASACSIVDALLDGGPAEDIDDYDEAPLTVARLLGQLERRAADLHHYLTVLELARFLAEDDDEWSERYERGWTPDVRQRLIQQSGEILAWGKWPVLAEAGLVAEASWEFHRASRVARSLGIDPYDHHLRRVAADPEHESWYHLMQLVDESRIDEVLALAERTIPLDEVATGPADVLFRGGWHKALGYVVQDLRRFPGRGWLFIAADLRSPVTGQRNMAVRVLNHWGPENWPAEVPAALRRVVEEEPNPDLRGRIEELLSDGRFFD